MTATDEKQKMSDDELVGQLTTFILAGHETTSTTLTWLMWTLAQHKDVQDKLRAEIRESRRKAVAEGREELNAEDLGAMEYLDAVVVCAVSYYWYDCETDISGWYSA
jgi:cytochrome P450